MGKKEDLLGISFGAASNRLKKSIMFNMAQRLGEDRCFRCGSKIETVGELSVEHKESWQLASDPITSFYDLNNIAFSHLSCNAAASSGGAVHADMTRLSPEKRREKTKRQYEREKNTERYKKYHRDYQRNRYNTDPEFRAYHIGKSKKYRNAPIVE